MTQPNQLLDQFGTLPIKGAFPKHLYLPSGSRKSFLVLPIAGKVGIELGIPERDVRLRPPATGATVAVPETAVNEHRYTILREYDIGCTRQISAVQSVSKPSGK